MSGNVISLHQSSEAYCSQLRKSSPEVENIEEGILVVEEILNRTILCRHDVKELNKAYRRIDHFERTSEKRGSEAVLDKIIEKIQKIAKEKNLASLISLYHLQGFSDKGLLIEDHFKALWNFTKSKEMIQHIARCLPCCSSESDFNQDVLALIGPEQDKEVAEILTRKKKLQKIGIRKLELQARINDAPNSYPKYLEELLDKGYLYLYDYLIPMISDPKQYDSIMKKMTCSELAFIVLQTRDAIIKKVEKFMTSTENKVLFLLGNKKVGKSTTLCFLRGDKMKQVLDSYESETDKEKLIGDGKTPPTLLPNIAVTSDWVIIDFPAFDHAHGELISLGIECALKALIKKYASKCLVLDSILEQSRFDSTSKLAIRLHRILNDKSHCVLGTTMYAQDPHFKKILTIEEEKREERLQPTPEESKLIGRIKRIRLEDKKKELQLQLEKMQKERWEKPLEETEKDREELEKKVEQLCKEIQLFKKIELKDLTDPTLAASCFKILSEAESLSVKPDQRLDSYIENLLKIDFKKKLKTELETRQDYQACYANFKDFEQKIRETSVINAFLSVSNPEIGTFLHLGEIDPNIVRKFDVTIATSCLEKCIKVVMCEVNISFIKKVLIEVKNEIPELHSKLEKLLKQFTDYILDLQMVPRKNDEQAEEEYNRIREEYIAAQKEAGKPYEYPTWAKVLFGIPLGIPLLITELKKWYAQQGAKQKIITEHVTNLYEGIKAKYDLLTNLKKIHIITLNNSKVDSAMHAGPILANSIEELYESLSVRIRQVRAAYGIADWEARISLLADSLLLHSYDPNKKTHFSFLLAYARLLIEPESSFKMESIGGLQKDELHFQELLNEKIVLNRFMSAAALLKFHKNRAKK